MKIRTYIITFKPQDFARALENTKEKSDMFLNPFHGDVSSHTIKVHKKVDWESGISRIMDEFDEAWRDLAHL